MAGDGVDENGRLNKLETAVRAALEIGPDSSAAARTIDITTTGARTGLARRIEIWFHHVQDRWYLSSTPARPSWYANVLANPSFTVHLKHGVQVDLPATAVPVDDPVHRRNVLTAIVNDLNQPRNPGRVPQPQDVEEWLRGSPLVEIRFTDARIGHR